MPASHSLMLSSSAPSICAGNGGKATHLNKFAILLDKIGQQLQHILSLDDRWPRSQLSLQALKTVVEEAHGYHDCPGCENDRRQSGLLDPLDSVWRRLQDPSGCEQEPLKELDKAIYDFFSPRSEILTVSADEASQLWFTHDSVRPSFSHGHLKGKSVEEFVEELVVSLQGHTTQYVVPDIHLHVVFHHGRFKSFGNRRTWALWEASRKLGRSLRVKVTVHPLVPGEKFGDGGSDVNVLKKFETSHTSKTNGNQPPMRADQALITECNDTSSSPEETITEPCWLQKYRIAKGSDGKPLRTSTLPLLDKLATVAKHIVEGKEKVFLMSGSTGCGKSTQVPQAVYDYVRNRDGLGRGPNIVCTQPRRVAACSLDDGVNADRFFREVWPEELGKRITAHQIQGEKNKGPDTRLLYCTAGVLLQMLRNKGHQGVREFHYVFLDEVHERTMDDDLLIGFLCSKPFLDDTNMKVIIMSATLAISTFLGYLQNRFGTHSQAVGTICLDRADHLDDLSISELQWLAESAGVDLSDCDEEQSHEDLVQFLVQAQVIRPHPMRLVYLDDLMCPIVCREGFQEAIFENGLQLKPVGALEPQLFQIADQAWKSIISSHQFKGREPLEVMLDLLEPSPVISEVREFFSKEFCSKLMQKKPRNKSVPVVNAQELERVRACLPMDGPPVFRISCTLAGGLIPLGSLLTSFSNVCVGGTCQRRAVQSWRDLPENYAPRMMISFASLISSDGIKQDSGDGKEGEVDASPYVALVFLPGLSLISDFQYALQDIGQLRTDEVYTLHSKVNQEQQAKAVQQIRTGRRAILANNIAESSITVPNADVVVDLSLQRTMRWNEDGQGQLLDMSLATKDSLNQRAGRVARTKAGLVVRLITREEFAMQPDSRQPEMLRRPVEKVMLKIINMAPSGSKYGVDAKSEIHACISPPTDDKIDEALTDLYHFNAIQHVRNRPGCFRALRMGVLLDDLPLDIQLGLIVAWGVQLGLEAMAVDAAAMMHAYNVVGEPRSTFQDGGVPFIEHCACLRRFANGFPSDGVMLVNLLREFRHHARRVGWVEATQDGVAIRKMQQWCLENSANYQSLQTLDSTVREIHKQLQAMLPLCDLEQTGLEHRWLTEDESMYLMFLCCGSFHRNMQQVRKGEQTCVSLGGGNNNHNGWDDSEIVISWDRSKSSKDTYQCIKNFFTHRHCGIYGEEVERGSQGAKGGWICIRLHSAYGSEQLIYGFPREVTDVLKLSRDFNKLCGDGETRMEMQHKASTRAVPVFWRWEELTEKRNRIVLQQSSVVTPYLEVAEMKSDELFAAIFAMDFESFHVKTQDRWQKAVGLTLLPCTAHNAERDHLPKVICAIFGPAGLKPEGVSCIDLQLTKMKDIALEVRKRLTGPQCVLQEFGDGTELDWVQQTRSLHSTLSTMFNKYGGYEALQALNRARAIQNTSACSYDDSDLSDSQLVDSEPESPLLSMVRRHRPDDSSRLPRGDQAVGIETAGVSLFVDFDHWWLKAGRLLGEDQNYDTYLQDNISKIEQQVGRVTKVFLYSSLQPLSAAVSGAQSSDAQRKQRATLQIDDSFKDKSVYDLHIQQVSSVGIALATKSLQHSGCLRQVEQHQAQPHTIVFLVEPASLKPLFECMNRQRRVDIKVATFSTDGEVSHVMGQSMHGKLVSLNPPEPLPAFEASAPPHRAPQVDSEPSSFDSVDVIGIPPGKRRGEVKSFNPNSGYGFIHGDKASQGKHVYLPKRNCLKGYVPSAGDIVFYKLGKQPDNKPVANLVEMAPGEATSV